MIKPVVVSRFAIAFAACAALAACGGGETADTDTETESEELAEPSETAIGLVGMMTGLEYQELFPTLASQLVQNLFANSGITIPLTDAQIQAMFSENFEPYADRANSMVLAYIDENLTGESRTRLEQALDDDAAREALTCASLRAQGNNPAYDECGAELGFTFEPDLRSAVEDLGVQIGAAISQEAVNAGFSTAACDTFEDVIDEVSTQGLQLTVDDMNIGLGDAERLTCQEWRTLAEENY